MKKDFKCFFDHGTGPIDLNKWGNVGKISEMRPVELHHKSNGSIREKPSFAIVLVDSLHDSDITDNMVYGQISLEMLNDGLKEIGYKLVKEE